MRRALTAGALLSATSKRVSLPLARNATPAFEGQHAANAASILDLDISNDGHPSDEDLEGYYLGLLKDDGGLWRLEEHLLTCHTCIDRAESAQDYVDLVRIALIRASE